MIIGEVCKQLRLRRGLTQDEVCKRTNLTQGYYSAIENGGTPSLETLTRLGIVFNLPIYLLIWLATEKKDIPKNQRANYNATKQILDNIFEEAIKKNDS